MTKTSTQIQTPGVEVSPWGAGHIGFDVLAPHFRHFGQAQEGVFGEVQTFSARWFARRQSMLRSTVDLAAGLGAVPGNFATAVALTRAWQQYIQDCLAEDVSDWFGLCQHCASALSQSELDAESDVLSATVPDQTEKNMPV